MPNGSKALTAIVGKNVQTLRKRMGLTQAGLAEILGIGQQAMSRMERGGIAPKFERLQDIASALNCRVTDLFHSETQQHHCGEDYYDEKSLRLLEIIREFDHEEKDAAIRIMEEMARILKKRRL